MGKRTYTYDGSEWVGLTSTTADLSQYAYMPTTQFGFRNKIINGSFDVWQRGTSFSSLSNSLNAEYTADRWQFTNTSHGTGTISRSTDVPSGSGFSYSLSSAMTSSRNPGIKTKLEGIEGAKIAGKVVTISFWAKSTNGSQTLTLSTSYATALDNFASTTEDASNTYTLTSAWERFSFTFTTSVSAANGYQISLVRNNGLGQASTTLFAGVQLEFGSIATPFEQRPIGTELALCQRYFQVPQSQLAFYYNSSNSSGELKLQQTMRAIPQLAVTGATVFQHTIGIQSGNITPISIGFTNSGTVTGGQLTFNQNATLASMATNTYYVIQSPFFTCSAEL